MGTGERFSIGKVHELLGERTGRVLGAISESLRKRAGKALGVMAAAALVVSGCAAPTPCNAEQQEQENPTADTQTDSEGNPDLDWQVIDRGCRDNSNCEPGERPNTTVAKACDGTTLLYRYSDDYFYQGGFTAVSNSPECGYIPPTAENSPTPTAEATPTPASGE